MKKVLSGLVRKTLYLISLLPFPVLYLLADVLYVLLYYIIGYRRKVVKTNLENSFPQKTRAELDLIEKKYFKFLADNILESIKMLSISPKSMSKRFVFVNMDVLKTHFDRGKPVLVTGGHYGNWEWGNLALPLVMKEKLLVVYKPLTDKAFELMMNNMRSRFGAIMVPMRQILRKIIEQKNELFFVALVGDQTPPREESQYFTTFLNQPTAVFLGIEKIAKLTGHPVLYCRVNKIKRGYYEASFKTLFHDPKDTAEYEITEAHTRELEKAINERPELWLWSHKRWKFKPDDIK
ncbi:lysophospholipid acyltransferase family protein [Pedobacter sp. SYSU D00535]|uniref:lysophospholipid acyltransferase family protein n=1 Tax=Pedobacter sp. SYSU D00535 TaxID=2810308 RepID=UPI001A977EBD|nr:lysophospholipid acyltransferase family protein [Pedobacter sp. SYSU D00535]